MDAPVEPPEGHEVALEIPLEEITEFKPNQVEAEPAPHPEYAEEPPLDAPTIPGNEAPAEGIGSPDDFDNGAQEKQAHFIQKLLLLIKKAFHKKTKPVADAPQSESESPEIPEMPSEAPATEALSALPDSESFKQMSDTDRDADSPDKNKITNLLNKILASLKSLFAKRKQTKDARAEESTSSNVEQPTESKDTESAGKPSRKSELRTVLGVLGVLCLMGISFAGGFFARDLLALYHPDPAQLQAEAEAKAKKVQDEKRAQELAQIKPKDYTSSMYLDSIILKGKAEKMTSIKLQKIDNIEKLVEFHNLRKITLVDMKGDEDLQVLQQLKGVEEISIENSVLKNQFSSGALSSVTYLEMYESTVENPSQFANFKGLTELFASTTKFPSQTGNLELTAYLPSIECLTLSNCGEYGELIGVNDLQKLKTLNLTSNTLVKNMTYVENPQIESAAVDISFAENLEQLRPLANFKNIKTLTLQAKTKQFSSSQLSQVKNWIYLIHPNATVETYLY